MSEVIKRGDVVDVYIATRLFVSDGTVVHVPTCAGDSWIIKGKYLLHSISEGCSVCKDLRSEDAWFTKV